MQQISKNILLRSIFEDGGIRPSDICDTPNKELFSKALLRINGNKVYSILLNDTEQVIVKSGNIVLDGRSMGATSQLIFNTFDILTESGSVAIKANCTMEDF